MDNTQIRGRPVLIKKRFNNLTGETVIAVKPKPETRKKIVIARGVSRDGTYTIGDVMLAKIRPFKSAMVTLLNRKGFAASGLNFKTVTVLYFNNFCANVAGKKQYDISAFINLPAFKIRPDQDTTADINDARNKTALMNITEVVNDVIESFRAAKMRYTDLVNSGFDPSEMLTDDQVFQARTAINIEMELLKKFKADHFLKASEVGTWLFWLIMFAAVAVLVNSLSE